jgi:UDP-N-acetylmuramoyl-L-alanyl-D-glutamate--2,6-diaminopimelate ligase
MSTRPPSGVFGLVPPAGPPVRDSRRAMPGAVYVAAGTPAERPEHIAQARAAGVASVLADGPEGSPDGVVAHARWAFARMSAQATGADRLAIPLAGVGGTKGKTTTCWCAWHCLGGPGRAARVGTIGWHDSVTERPNPQTTPPPDELHAFLASLDPALAGACMEISSHGADQHRCAGLRFAGMAYTGLGHDHLDYHHTVGAYLGAKLRAFRWLRPAGLAVINADDATAHVAMHAASAAGARVVGLGREAGEARLAADGRGGWRLTWAGRSWGFPSRLPGDFNAWNAAAGALLAHACGVALDVAVDRLGSLPPPPGRMELLAMGPATYVDYAHTPESIALALRAVRAAHPGVRLGIVFGCGGDRDPSKRAPMGQAAAAADIVVITTDNARSEDPGAIAAMVAAGCPQAQIALDRGAAIVLARTAVGPDGVVVVAGKGHEATQIVGGQTLAWDDRAFVRGQPGGLA